MDRVGGESRTVVVQRLRLITGDRRAHPIPSAAMTQRQRGRMKTLNTEREGLSETVVMDPKREHIFISYASEQAAICDWLARRLAAEGYRVWYDRLKLLGGEDWIDDIDVAIAERTFRMVALLSKDSMRKKNPKSEWLKGLAIGEKLGIDEFVIPLNTEGLKPDEIIWYLQSINYISFSPSWADGLSRLLRKLRSINAPRTLSDGRQIALDSFNDTTALTDDSEILASNCFRINQIPEYIHEFTKRSGKLTKADRDVIHSKWPCRDIGESKVLAFADPPADVREQCLLDYTGQSSWRNRATIHGLPSRDLVVGLIHRCLNRAMSDSGLAYCSDRRRLYIPDGLTKGNRVSYILPNGSTSWFRSVGKRAYWTGSGTTKYRYHLSPSFAVLRDCGEPSMVILTSRVYLTDLRGRPLHPRQAVSRRKHLCKGWFNREWCARSLGMAQLLADQNAQIRYGPPGRQQFIMSGSPILFESPQGIDDHFGEGDSGLYIEWHADDHMEDQHDETR